MVHTLFVDGVHGRFIPASRLEVRPMTIVIVAALIILLFRFDSPVAR